MKSCSFVHIEQKVEFEKFNYFFYRFFKIWFWDNKSYFDRG